MKDTKELTTDRAPDGAFLCVICHRPQTMRPFYASDSFVCGSEEECYRLGFERLLKERAAPAAPSSCPNWEREKARAEVAEGDAEWESRALAAESAAEELRAELRAAIAGQHAIPGRAEPAAGPSSPSDLSARETEDQKELTRAPSARTPSQVLRNIDAEASCEHDYPCHCWNEEFARQLNTEVSAGEQRGRERGIEEARSAITKATCRRRHDHSDTCAYTAAHEAIRLLAGNAAPQATPSSLSDPSPPVVQENQQGACGADSEET